MSQRPRTSVIQSAAGALNIAAQMSGVPALGVATSIVQQIANVSQEVSVNKSECKMLAEKSGRLLLAYHEQCSRLEGSELLRNLDEVTNVLEGVLSRVRKWASYSYPTSLFRKSQIEAGIVRCTAEIDNAIRTFEINSQGVLHQNNRRLQEAITRNHNDLMEMFINLTNHPEDMGSVVQRHQAGEEILAPLMRTGQDELRVMRTRFADDPSSSNQESNKKYNQYEETLLSLHRETGIPPTVKRLDGEITRQGDIPFTGGLYCDVWLGTWLGKEKVALKALRGIKAKERVQQRFEREIEFWAKLQHPNILPFYGIVTNIGQQIHMVSPWQSHGNLLEYVKRTPDADQLALWRGSASGLSYLHSSRVVHGNVKCTNVLISSEREPRICDFGMSKVMEEVTEISASKTLTSEGSARYVAPELIESNEASTTVCSDTYSFAMLILECATQKAPFAHLRRDAAVIHAIVNKKQCPARPENPEATRWMTDELWEMLKKCWSTSPESRPTMEEVHAFLIQA